MKAKQPHSKSTPRDGANTRQRQRCSELIKERDLLQQEISKLKAERDQYLKALCALTREPLDFDKKAILAEVGKHRPLRELIAELELPGT